LLFAVQVEGHELRTVEGLATDGTLHPLQRAFVEHRALQCGFCTPGFLMLSLGILDDDPDISPGELRNALSSNICRCTGYIAIVDAVTAYQNERRSTG
jgi:carbon-monoxide dehydrogenase small subunit